MAEKGTVKWYNVRKGFGFIEYAGGDDLFVHATSLKGNPLKDGDEVEFDLGTDEKTGKQCATNVTGGSGWPKTKGRGKGKGASRVREGDWTCPKCNVNVFASKNNCFKCNEPKPE